MNRHRFLRADFASIDRPGSFPSKDCLRPLSYAPTIARMISRFYPGYAFITKSFAFFLSAIAWAATAHAAGPSYTDPTMTDADFPFQGEYVGTRKTEDGVFKVGLQVIALGKGKFHLVEYRGGLPGDGWKKGAEKNELDG
jgi:hypothetical protein